MNKLDEFTEGILLVEYVDTNQLLKDFIQLSRKGIYCFDINKENEQQYVKIAEPINPLDYDELPQEVKNVFSDNRVDLDVMIQKIIRVEHAYK